jgi:sugar porter (SP) family MFS transporter
MKILESKRSHIVLISLIVALGGFLMGFDASVISGVVKFIEPEFDLSKIELGWAVSSLTLASTIAMMIAGPLSDRWGRRRVLTIAALMYAFSAILSAIAPNFIFLVVARMIGGLGVGASLIIAPMYIAEISPAKIRGKMVSFNQLNIVIGISAAFFTNFLVLKLGQSNFLWAHTLGFGLYTWRWMLGIETLPALLYFFALFSVPHSPRWLIMRQRNKEALIVLKSINDEEKALQAFEEVRQSYFSDQQKAKTTFRELFKPALRIVLTIGIVLAVLQQLSGINAIFFYAPMIFEQSGLGTDAAFTQAIYVGLTNLLFTVFAMLLIDKLGRKPLLIVGISGIALSMFVLAYGFKSATYRLSLESLASFTIDSDREKLKDLTTQKFSSDRSFKSALEKALGKPLNDRIESQILAKSIHLNTTLILSAIIGFVASFAVSIGPVMWVMFSELFPNAIRAMAVSFVGFINSITSFSVQLVFPWEISNLGTAPTFLIYGIVASLGLVFILLRVPETKGKSLEELQKLLITEYQSNQTRTP